jgi:uncharacterized protein (DUF2384 family)
MTDTPDPGGGAGSSCSLADAGIAAMPDNIRALQALRRYTDQQMAEAIGVSQATWERRKKAPELWTHQQARRIARVLDVALGELTRAPGEARRG